MTLLSALYFLVLLVYVAMAAIVISRNPKSRLNWSCAFILLSLAIWAFEDVFHYWQPRISPAAAQVFANIGGIGGYSFAAFFLVFALLLTGRKRYLESLPIVATIVGLPVLLIVFQWMGLGAVKLRTTGFGWEILWTPTILSVLYYVYYFVFTLLGIILLLRYGRTTADWHQQRQSIIIALTALISLVLATFTDVVCPWVFPNLLPELGGILAVVWAVGLYWAMTRHGLLAVTPETAANDILATMPDALFLLSPEGRIIVANPAAVELTGVPAKELVGQSVAGLFTDPEVCHTALQQVLERDVLSRFELTCRTRDGDPVPVAAAARTMKDPKGMITGTVWVLRNITALKRAEQAQRESEQRYRELVERANDGIVVVQDAIIKYANLKMAELNGSTREEIIGTSFMEHVHPDTLVEVVRHYQRRMAGESAPAIYETVLVRRDGERIDAELNAGLITYEGRPADLVFVRDITERKRVERALRESEENFRQLAENAHDGILIALGDGSHVFANRRAAEITGYSVSELLLIGMPGLVHPDEAEKVKTRLEERLAGRPVPSQYETAIRTKHGERRDIELTAARTVWQGKPADLVIIRDITARKQAEIRMRRTLDELARSNADLEQFAYAASHDLQGPLRTIAGFVSLLSAYSHDRLDEKAREYVTHITDGVQRMQRLIDALLAYARVGTRGKPFQMFNSTDALKTAIANLESVIQQTQARIHYESLPTVMGDELQLALVFQNLLDNALKFRSANPPEVYICATPRDGEWVFSVRDNGIGIDPKYFDRIFKVFQRLHTVDQYPGSGMGLAICERIVRRHRGRMWVESEPGKGTTFFFTLPLEKVPDNCQERNF